MKIYLFLLLVSLTTVSGATKEVDISEEFESAPVSEDRLIVHQDKDGEALVSLPAGLKQSKIRFLPQVEDGVVRVNPRAQMTLLLPNPKIKLNLRKIRSFTLESSDQEARSVLAQALKAYYESYQEQFLKTLNLDSRFSPLEPMLSVALYDVQKMSLDKVIAIEKRLLTFKGALDGEAARFYAHNYSLVSEIQTLKASRLALESRLQKLETTRPAYEVRQETAPLFLTPKKMELLLLVSLLLGGLSLGILLLNRN
jgi:hypothetical protein